MTGQVPILRVRVSQGAAPWIARAIHATARAIAAAGVLVEVETVANDTLAPLSHDQNAFYVADVELQEPTKQDATWIIDALTIALDAIHEFVRDDLEDSRLA